MLALQSGGARRLLLGGFLALAAAMFCVSGCRESGAPANGAQADTVRTAAEESASPAGSTAVRSPPPSIVNRLGITLVWVPGGESMMGSPPGEEARGDDERLHRVRVSGFWIGACEVTRGQFRRFADETGYCTDAERRARGGLPEGSRFDPNLTDGTWRNPGFDQGDDHPVVNVSWNDASAFCEWLSRHEGSPYRLPTEAEWEHACRAGTKTRFSTGESSDDLHEWANLIGEARSPGGGWIPGGLKKHPFTSPVGAFPANAFGLYDMHGNVWEWCADRYAADYYSHSPRQDPQGPDSGATRVVRGGSHNSKWLHVRSANRAACPPGHWDFTLGFRVARCG